jgi:hypothetical protein
MSRALNLDVPSARTVSLTLGEDGRAIAYRSFDPERGCLDFACGTWSAIESEDATDPHSCAQRHGDGRRFSRSAGVLARVLPRAP